MFAVVAPFSEGLRAAIEPCSFLMVAPALTAVVAAGVRWQAMLAALSAGVVGGWMLVDNRWILDGRLLQLSAVLVAMLLVALAVPAVRAALPRARLDRPAPQAAMVAVVSLIASLWWRPCVGAELGGILNGARDGLGRQLVPMAAYMLGILFVVPVIVALRYAVDPPERALAWVGWAAGAAGVVVAASLAAGQHDEVVVTLTRWTLE